ncbi:Sensor histidine kinase YpdA [compost metagenome]
MMPGLSGYETCRQIRRQHALSELPVLLTTVRSEQDAVMHGFEAGANDYLTKPFEPYELRARARTLLEMKRSAEEAVRSEMAFLQAQIKPHFLYNALNTIVSLSLEEPQTAHDLLLYLGRYLRGSFDFKNKERLVPLRKELEIAEAYLKIERARFGDRLQIRYEIDDYVDCLLPPLTLQPLVENAVRHGVTKLEDGGTVTISVRVDIADIVICVEDDGVGMTEPAHQIFSREGDGNRGIGLKNIHQRMLRQFGKGLEMESERGHGTKVTIRIPLAIKAVEEGLK